MERLIAGSLGFVMVVIVLVFGGGISAITYNITENISHSAGVSGTLATIFNSGSVALTTMAAFLPIVAIALAGGLALYYLISFVGGALRGGSGAM